MTIRESMSESWRGLTSGMRVVFGTAAVTILVLLVWGIYWAFRDDYGTLFTQLSDSDAAAIVESLKKQKVPYKLSDGGATISVPADHVHETRLLLMSGNVPLSGGVGFEIFDKQGLGATEQSQRVTFQRALQGELSRTIVTLDNVKAARVHLVLPESSLFKRDKQESTAAVTLTLKPGHSLEPQQIVGVQRLVAASVAGLDPSRVIVTDQRGVTLSSTDPTGGSALGIESRLELQRQVEAHIAQKISRILDKTYGSGQAIISVAVALSFDAVKTMTQDVLPSKSGNGAIEAGVVRKRQVITGASDPLMSGEIIDASNTSRRTNSTLEVEYEHGKRVEEVISAPGAVKRISVGVIVPPRISDDQQRRIKEFVVVAAGIDESRGDLVSVQSLATGATNQDAAPNEAIVASNDETTPRGAESSVSPNGDSSTAASILSFSTMTWVAILASVLVFAVIVVVTLRGRSARSLTAQERADLLKEIRRTLGDDSRVTHLPTN